MTAAGDQACAQADLATLNSGGVIVGAGGRTMTGGSVQSKRMPGPNLRILSFDGYRRALAGASGTGTGGGASLNTRHENTHAAAQTRIILGLTFR
ncbi:hypothetical protein B0E47_13940 [Rhodanobacter sp. B05]|nr:hypothetical protein B0E47_13940 [Rhodanobacter sp. B05]